MLKKQIPNLLTLSNLVCGCIAIAFVFDGKMHVAGIYVLIAAGFDFLDGFTARALNVAGPMGKELDSLADMITFGVVPSMIAYQLIDSAVNAQFAFPLPVWTSYLKYGAFIIAALSAYRLAKFNIDDSQSDQFVGIPTPANALFWIGIPLSVEHHMERIPEIVHTVLLNPWFVLFLSVLLGILLVAPIPLLALKFKSYSWNGNGARYLLLIGSLALLITLGFMSLPIIIALYLLISIANTLMSRS